MAVTIDRQERLGPTTYRVHYSSSLSDPTYYIYRDGILAEETSREWVQVEIELGEHTQIDILDDANTAPAGAYPGRALLTWYAVDGADRYMVEEFVDAEWTERQTVWDQGQGYFSWESRWLEDDTTHQFRVTPIDAQGVEGTAKEWSMLMVRRPDIPSLTITYDDGTGKLTLASAS